MRKIMKKLSAIALAIVMVVAAIGILPTANIAKASGNPTVKYMVHRQTYGWETGWKSNGQSSGTVGEGKRLESIKIKVEGANLGIQYRTHIQSYGWETDWRADGALSGTEGKAKRLEAIQIKLTGADASKYDVYYRVHAQTYGWMGWVKNGESAGTAGQAKRLEAIQIVILPKGTYPSEGSMGCGFVDIAKKPSHTETGAVTYMTHVQSYGDQAWVSDGSIAGTSGEAKRLEQISIKMNNAKLNNVSGGVEYKTHVQSYGWMNWVKDGARSGTSGQGKRLEGIKIRLTGDLANKYDIYYRVHAQSYGWLGWVKNGAPSGTEGYGKRLEAIQVVVVPKGTPAPNYLPAKSGQSGFVSKTGTCSDKDGTSGGADKTPYAGCIPTGGGFFKDGYFYFNGYKGNKDFGNTGDITVWFKYDLSTGAIKQMPVDSSDDRSLVYIGQTRTTNDTYISNYGLYSMESGKYIYTLKDNQYWVNNFDGVKAGSLNDRCYEKCAWSDENTILMYQKDIKFEGNVYSLGILNNKGEWVMPMTSEYSDLLTDFVSYGEDDFGYRYLGDNNYEIAGSRKFYLNSATKKITTELPDSFTAYAYLDGKLVGEDGRYNVAFYDLATGKYTLLEENNGLVEKDFDDSFWSYCKYVQDGCFWYKKGNMVYGVASDGKVKATYDLSKYDKTKVYAVSKDVIYFECTNSAANRYECLMNTDGVMSYEPVMIGGQRPDPANWNNPMLRTVIKIDDGKLIVYNSRNLFVHDFTTKKEAYVNSSKYSVYSYDEDTNMFVVIVKKEGDSMTEYTYLVSMDDLNTLINPFE